MSKSAPKPGEPDNEKTVKEVNLALIYGAFALALAVAIGFAVMIVFPFYARR